MKCFHTYENLNDKVRTIASNKFKVYFGCKNLYEIDLKTQKETKLEMKEDYGSIYSLKYFPEENFLLVGYHDGYIQIIQNMKIMNTFKAHKQEVKCFANSHKENNSNFFSGSYDKTIKHWDLKKLKEISTFEHSNPVNDMLILDENLFTASQDGLSCFDENLKKIYQKNDHKGEILSICNYENFMFTASKDSTWKIFDLTVKSSISTVSGHKMSLSRILRDDESIFTSSADKTIRKWNLHGYYEEDCLIGHSEPIRSLDLVKVKNGKSVVVSGGQDNCVKLWK
eukprot:gene56-4305_t